MAKSLEISTDTFEVQTVDALEGYLAKELGTLIVISDASLVTNPHMRKELHRPTSICLFDKTEQFGSADTAPYLFPWLRTMESSKTGIFEELQLGSCLLLSTTMELHALKRRLKTYLWGKAPNHQTFHKYYIAINFLYFLETNRDMRNIFRHINSVVGRNFERQHDFFHLSGSRR